MTKIFFRLALFFSCFCFFCHAKQQTTKSRKKGLYITAKIGSWKEEDGFNCLFVRTVLTNNSPDTIRYINFSCSWQMCYTTDSHLLVPRGTECDKNFPKVFTILPYSNEEEKLVRLIRSADSSNIHNVKFRVGFNYVPFSNYADFRNDIEN